MLRTLNSVARAEPQFSILCAWNGRCAFSSRNDVDDASALDFVQIIATTLPRIGIQQSVDERTVPAPRALSSFRRLKGSAANAWSKEQSPNRRTNRRGNMVIALAGFVRGGRPAGTRDDKRCLNRDVEALVRIAKRICALRRTSMLPQLLEMTSERRQPPARPGLDSGNKGVARKGKKRSGMERNGTARNRRVSKEGKRNECSRSSLRGFSLTGFPAVPRSFFSLLLRHRRCSCENNEPRLWIGYYNIARPRCTVSTKKLWQTKLSHASQKRPHALQSCGIQ